MHLDSQNYNYIIHFKCYAVLIGFILLINATFSRNILRNYNAHISRGLNMEIYSFSVNVIANNKTIWLFKVLAF